jgi:tetraacyldisaccharide 4'-kinase
MTVRRWWAIPLVPLYAAALRVQERLRKQPRALQWPVVSVGSLSAGGAGKTPVVLALAELLRSEGWGVDVLSRGYGRSGDEVLRVEPELEDAAQRFGDEPVLLARRGRVPVWVGAERYKAGFAAEAVWDGVERRSARSRSDDSFEIAAAAEARAVPVALQRVHLLDDGFQHRNLARAMDVVVVTGEDLEDALLPAGNRREPLSALGRADAIVVRDREQQRVVRDARPWLRAECAVWTIRRTLRFPTALAHLSLGARPLAFCAIARPENFTAMLRAAGCNVVETISFADHHAYTGDDIARIVQTAQQARATGFVITEKDAVKLTADLRKALTAVAPLLVAVLQVEFEQPQAVLAALRKRLA